MVGEGVKPPVADDQVIQKFDPKDLCRGFDLRSDSPVLLARRRVARRVVVNRDDGQGIRNESNFEDLARLNGSRNEGSERNLRETGYMVPGVQTGNPHRLSIQVLGHLPKQIINRLGIIKGPGLIRKALLADKPQ